MFSGPYFARPGEIDHEPSRMFYKREVFAVEQPDISVPMVNIEASCIVLPIKDYIRCKSVLFLRFTFCFFFSKLNYFLL